MFRKAYSVGGVLLLIEFLTQFYVIAASMFTTTPRLSPLLDAMPRPASLSSPPGILLHGSCSSLSRFPLSLSAIRLEPRPILEREPMAEESPLKLLLPSLRL